MTLGRPSGSTILNNSKSFFSAGVVSYTATAPYRSEKGRIDLLDDSFDGFLEEGKIKDGLGQLIDGVRGSKESPLNPGRVLGGEESY